jgi:hypothetical protein
MVQERVRKPEEILCDIGDRSVASSDAAESKEPYSEELSEAIAEYDEVLLVAGDGLLSTRPAPQAAAEEPISKLHNVLAQRYSSLKAVRGQLPVFCLEHGLAPEARKRLISLVGTEVRRRGVGRWWRDRYLPLLAAASETGYSYLGTGTDFWPRLSSDLGADIAPHEREDLSGYFALGHREHGLRKPVPTPWNRAFRHIAWPICNAMAPLEIHRPLAKALREAFRNLADHLDEATLVEALRYAARRVGTSRLNQWLADSDLAAAVSLRLLGRLDPIQRLSSDTLDRILGDLSADKEALRAVEWAVARSVAAKVGDDAARGQNVSAIGRCSLCLAVSKERGLELSLLAPRFPPEIRSRLLTAFAIKNYRISLWGVVSNVDPAHFLSGLPVPLPLNAPPRVGAAFLPGLEGLGLEAGLARRLSEIAPDLSPPMIFRIREGNAPAFQSREPTLARGAKYFVLVGQGIDRPIDGLRAVGEVAGLRCIEADTSCPEAAAWLSARGIKIAGGLSVEISGGLLLGEGPKGPLFAPGFPIIIAPQAEGISPWPITVRQLGADGEEVLSAERPLAVVDALPGQHTLLLESPLGKYEVSLAVADEVQPVGLISVEAEPFHPTMDDLISGAVVFRITSPLPVESVLALATLTVAGSEVARSADVLPRVPTVVGGASGLLRCLAERSKWQLLPRDASVELSLDIGGVWRGQWRLGWALRECTWESHGGTTTPFDDNGPLPVVSVPAEIPLSTPERAHPSDGFRLLLAEVDGAPIWDAGLCVGPRSVALGQPHPKIEGRLLRRAESETEGWGLIPCLQAYVAWAASTSAHLLADAWRRSISTVVEAAAVEQLCGRHWARAEVQMRGPQGDRWDILTRLAASRRLALGTEFPTVSPAELGLFVSFLQSQLRAAIPDLWERSTTDLDADALGQSFDEAVNLAYGDLAAEQVAQGRFPCEEADAGKDPIEWLNAVRDVIPLYEMRSLATMVLPLRRATALVAPDYSALSTQEVISLLDEVHIDVQGRPRWLSADDLRIAFDIWTDPRGALRSAGWREAAERLLSDMQTARAVRYAALRFRAARNPNISGSATDG